MLFNSYTFIFAFLPVVLAGFAVLGRVSRRAAIGWLVAASLFFYGWWNPAYVPLLLLSVAVNGVLGALLIQRASLALLSAGVAFNLLLIGYFKYLGFFGDTLAWVAGSDFGIEAVILPLGISFFTFQQIAYLVDAHRRRVVAHDWLDYALFVTFFPQLIAGPIVHQAEILPQLRRSAWGLRSLNLAIGATIFIIGLFKKSMLADSLALYAGPVFDTAATGTPITFLEAWGGAMAYTLQLYFDFSGYSDMAIGLARMFGIRLPLNFHSPYKATSIIDFWRRWHMTLSRFLRDYLYIPLGGNRHGPLLRYRNLMIVMLLGGLWHGAGWTFVLWGGLHGLYLLVNHAWQGATRGLRFPDGIPARAGRVLAWALTFLAVVVAWVFFRAPTLDAALNILHGMTGLDGRLVVTVGYVSLLSPLEGLIGPLSVSAQPLPLFHGREQIAWIAGGLAIALVLPNTQQWMRRYAPALGRGLFRRAMPRWAEWRPTVRWAGAGILLLALALVATLQPSEFLYFQF